MNMKKIKIVTIAALALGLTGLGAGGAFATTAQANPSSSSSTSVANAPDATQEAPGTETNDPAESEAMETPGTEQAGTNNDGNDGGHADQEGVDVNHEGGDSEK